jgi:SAM-dependent methyltransferase
MTERSTTELYESIQARLRDIIKTHLKTSAVSISSFEAKRTGNAYQAVRLGDEVVKGFRSAQRHVFAGVDLRNKTVLDLGANLGEVSRDAARAGAASVLGLEYDRYFVQMARLIAAHDDLSNVNFTQGDLSKPETYAGRYDVVVALSVFAYVKGYVGKLAAMTNELLIMETHAVKKNWHKQYIKELGRHFPYVAVVGASDHKASSTTEWRYLLYCSHKPLDGILATRARDLTSTEGLLTLDMARSSVPYLDKVLDVIGVRPGDFEEVASAASAYLQSRPAEESFEQITKRGLVRAPHYWCHFLAGYGEYRARGRIDAGNTYYRLLAQLVERGLYDGAFKTIFKRPDGGIPRLELRYRMIDELLGKNDGGESLHPVILYDILERDQFRKNGPALELFIEEAGGTVCPLAIDGHHRTFVAYIAGARRLCAVPVWYQNSKSVLNFVRRHPGISDALWASVYPFSEKLAGVGTTGSGNSSEKLVVPAGE